MLKKIYLSILFNTKTHLIFSFHACLNTDSVCEHIPSTASISIIAPSQTLIIKIIKYFTLKQNKLLK